MQAILHGADAVYIGADHHGARAAAGNNLDDIGELCAFAHKYMARVYVTVNTIVYDNELDGIRELLEGLAARHVDALLVQDMAIVKMIREAEDGSPLSYFRSRLHASTQTDNRTSNKVAWLHGIGFGRVVLARETTLDDMARIHAENQDVELEAFVHGALCVSYSGLCYASQHCFKRSANRGECAQFCRMKFDLVDSNDEVIERDRYMLSLKDMCQIDNLGRMADAGITSFKIEGRLKDLSYVKNVVAAYSRRLDEIVKANPQKYCRASIGRCQYRFEPDLDKTFNRRYTTYFLDGRVKDISSPMSPKAIGKYIGRVKEIRNGSFNVSTTEVLANGDGLCFMAKDRELIGVRANKVVGNRVFPLKMPEGIKPGMALYRNSDFAFEKLLSAASAERKIDIRFKLDADADMVALTANGSFVFHPTTRIKNEFEKAQKPQADNIKTQLSKLGNTVYECVDIELAGGVEQLFIPSSRLAALRKEVVALLDEAIAAYMTVNAKEMSAKLESSADDLEYRTENVGSSTDNGTPQKPDFYGEHGYMYNIANKEAADFYKSQGLVHQEPAYELKEQRDAMIMQCKHCIRYACGFCVKHGGEKPRWKEPVYLALGDGRRFRLEFNCTKCQMNIRVDYKKRT